MASNMAINDRAMGQFPISIATSLALESAFGIMEGKETNKPPINDYPGLWINLRTLHRNLMGSMNPADSAMLLPNQIGQALFDEMEMIREIIADKTKGKTVVTFYISDYQGIEAKYPKALVRRDNTERQKEATNIANLTFKAILSTENDFDIQVFKQKLVGPKHRIYAKSLIITNYAYDLLSAKSFEDLVLLESHTGAIKPKGQWYQKYQNGKDLVRIPFTEYFMAIFGDSQTFAPMEIKIRREILELADKTNWSQLTTDAKIRYFLDKLPNRYLADIVKSMM